MKYTSYVSIIFFFIITMFGAAQAVHAHAGEKHDANTLGVNHMYQTAAASEAEAGFLTPSSPFYFLEEWGRGFKRLITFDDMKQARYNAEVADEKAAELADIARETQDPEEVREALQEYSEEYPRLQEALASLEDQDEETDTEARKDVEELFSTLTEQRVLHEDLVTRIEEQFNDEGVSQETQKVRQWMQDTFAQLAEKDDPEALMKRLDRAFARLEEADTKGMESTQEVSVETEGEGDIHVAATATAEGGEARAVAHASGATSSVMGAFRAAEMSDGLRKGLPEEMQERLEEKHDALIERISDHMEALSEHATEGGNEMLESFKERLVTHPGDKAQRHVIIEEVRSRLATATAASLEEASSELSRNIMAENRTQIKERAQKQIEEAEEAVNELASTLEEGTTTTDRTMGTSTGMAMNGVPTAVQRLHDRSTKHLESARTRFSDERYGPAFGSAVAAEVAARNGMRIYDTFTDTRTSFEMHSEMSAGHRDEETGEERSDDATQKKKAEKRISEAEKAIASLEDALEGNGTTTTHADRVKDDAQRSLARAKETFDSEQYGRAIGHARQAMHIAEHGRRLLEAHNIIANETEKEGRETRKALREDINERIQEAREEHEDQWEKAKEEMEERARSMRERMEEQRDAARERIEEIRERLPEMPGHGTSSHQGRDGSDQDDADGGGTVACTMQYDPVCGVDGETYSNRCVAEQQNGVEVAHEGRCGNSNEGQFREEHSESFEQQGEARSHIEGEF